MSSPASSDFPTGSGFVDPAAESGSPIAARLDALAAMTTAMAEARSESELFNAIANHVADVLPHEHASLLLFEETATEISVVPLGDDPGDHTGPRVPAASSSVGLLGEIGVMLSGDLSNADYDDLHHLAIGGLGSAVVAPLSLGAGPIGGLALARTQTDAFSADDVAVARHLGELIAIAAASARANLRAEASARAATRAEQLAGQRAHEMEVLHRIVDALGRHHDVVEAGNDLTRELVGLRGVDVATLSMAGDTGLRLVASAVRNRRPGLPSERGPVVADSPLHQRAMIDGRSVLVRSGDAETAGFRPADAGLTSYLVVPIITGGESVGVLTLGSTKRNRTVADEHVPLAEAAAVQIAGVSAAAAMLAAARRSSSEAEDAARSRATFLAALSHEMRPALNTIIGMTALLAEPDVAADGRRRDGADRDGVEVGNADLDGVDDAAEAARVRANRLDLLRRSGDALLSLVDDVADVAEVATDDIELAATPFSLRAVVEDSLDVVAAAAGEKGLDLAYDLDPALPEQLVGDPARVRQVLINLLTNGVEHTEHGSVVVRATGELAMVAEPTISAQPPTAAGPAGVAHTASERGDPVDGDWAVPVAGHPLCSLRFAVTDTGCGMSPDRLDELFPPLGVAGATADGESTIGLSIAKHLARRMGGRLWAESTEGAGSTFHCELLIAVAADQPKDESDERLPGLVGSRMLLAGPNAELLDIVARQLGRWGIEVVLASSIAMALDLVRQLSVEVALVDDRFGDTGSVTTCAVAPLVNQLRTGGFSGPVVELRSFEHSGPSTAIDAIVHKPVKPAELCTVLHRLRGRDTSDGAAGASPRRRLGDRHPLQVLLVAGNAPTREHTTGLLATLGYQVDNVDDLDGAVDAALGGAYDLVLCTAGGDTVGFPARLDRELATQRRPRVVLIDGTADGAERRDSIVAGFDDHVASNAGVEVLTVVLASTPRLSR